MDILIIILLVFFLISSLISLYFGYQLYQTTSKINDALDKFLEENTEEKSENSSNSSSGILDELGKIRVSNNEDEPVENKSKKKAKLNTANSQKGIIMVFLILLIFAIYYFYSGSETDSSFESAISAQKTGIAQGGKVANGDACIEEAFRQTTSQCKDENCRRSIITGFALQCLQELAKRDKKLTEPPCGMPKEEFTRRYCQSDQLHKEVCAEGIFSEKIMKTNFYCPF